MLAAGVPLKQVARAVGVHERTVGTWAAEPDVCAAVAAFQASTVEAARREIASNALRIAKALLAKGANAPAPGDVRAMLAALSCVGLGATSRVQVDARVTSTVPDELLPLELARALREVLADATGEIRAAVRVELAAIIGEAA